MAATTLLSDNGVTSGITGYTLTGGNDGTLQLQTTTSGGTATTALTINTSQNVGIGTSSPAYKLDIVSANANSVHWKQTGTANGDGFLYSDNNGSGIFDTASGSGNGMYLYKTGNTIWWNTNATERMRIDSSGNLGLGVTPSAWYAGYTANNIGYSGAIWSNRTSADTNVVMVGLNTYLNAGAANWTYQNTGYASRYQQDSGAHKWLTAPSGSAGSAVTFTQAMTLDASGNLGIGTSSPTQKLHVYAASGSIRSYTETGNTSSSAFTAKNTTDATDFGTDSTGGFIQVQGAHPLLFYTNATERARIDSSGNLLVGSTSVGSSVGFQLQIAGNGASKPAMNVNGASTSSADAGYILYSTTGAANKFYVDYAGTVHAVSTSITAISDQTLKTNIKPLETGLTQILALQPKRYDWLDGTGENIAGFIAQEVQEVLPDLVSTFKYNEEESKLGLRMGDILPTLVKAVQEQQALIQQLTTRLEALENK